MAVIVDTQDGIRLIRLSGPVDIAQAADLKCALIDAMASGQRVRIQVAAVSEIDATTVQLLWAAASQAKSAGSALILEGPLSEAVQSSLAVTGLSRLLASLIVPSEEEAGSVLAIRN